MAEINRPLVSVVITTYNRGYCIADALNSVLSQTYRNFEVILIDDGSTDNTEQVVRGLGDERIFYRRLPQNCHISAASNIGLSMAKGELIARLDSDDRWLPGKLEMQVSYLESHPECGACFTYVEFTPALKKGENPPYWYRIFEAKNRSRAEWLHDLYFTGNRFCNTSALFRSSLLKTVGLYDCSLILLHDFDFWVRTLKKTDVYVIDQPLTVVHWDSGKESDNISVSSDIASELRHSYELSYIRAHYFDGMEDGLFREAFQKELIRPDFSDPEHLACEKAFLLFLKPEGDFDYRRLHRLAGAHRLTELLNHENTRKILEQDYSFTPKDFYAYTGSDFYGTPVSSEKKLKRLQQELSDVRQQYEDMRQQCKISEQNCQALILEVQNAKSQLEAIQQSTSWKITKPIRSVMDRLHKKR